MKNIKKKGELHPNNPHRGRYNIDLLAEQTADLKKFIKKNPKGEKTIDFSNNEAVVLLNKALLKTYYNINYWEVPKGFLCPPIPGRADYIHYIAQLLNPSDNVRVLDIGTGANCIYPLLGSQSYAWDFVGSDIDFVSIENALKIIKANKNLKGNIELRLQKNKNNIFRGIIKKEDKFNLTMCNPPFHSSLEEALKANQRKVKNLSKANKSIKKGLNFGGQKAELWCPGGEREFLKKMAKESVSFASQVKWFTTLISNKDNIKIIQELLKSFGVSEIKILEMSQGQKISRILAWTFEKNHNKKGGRR